MRQKTLLAILMLTSLSCFGLKKYTLPKADFVQQFTGGIQGNRLTCYAADGRKVWFYFDDTLTFLTLILKNNRKKELKLHAVQYKDGNVTGIERSTLMVSRKQYAISLDEVVSLEITQTLESVSAWFNADSCKSIVRHKNDSLKADYRSRENRMIEWVAQNDTLAVLEGACYNMGFSDNNTTEYGIVQRITQDSICISSVYNESWAKSNKKEYRIFTCAIKDITQLRLLKAGGYGYKTVRANESKLSVLKVDKSKWRPPYWFAMNPGNGETEFFRAWLTGSGFPGIREENGRVYWYEGY